MKINGVHFETLADGRTALRGNTFTYKDQIKAAGGLWAPATKSWTVPAGADLSFIKETVYLPVLSTLRRDRSGRCCSAAKAELDKHDPQGPLWYVCTHHGKCRSSYTGD
jgi:hypothetical protein